MKLVIKLVVVALVLNATYQIGSQYAVHWRFTDDLQELVQFSGNKPEEDTQSRVMQLAVKHGIPIRESNVTVKVQGPHTYVDGTYVRTIEPFPGYKREWPFAVHVDAITSMAAAPTTPK